MTSHRVRVIAGACSVACLLAACTSTTNGAGRASSSANSSSSTPLLPSSTSAPLSSQPPASESSAPSTQANGSTIVPAPSAPLRTVVVHGTQGATYVVKIWVQVENQTCFDHAYGQVQTFLTEHTCGGLTRLLATTTVNGRPVGFAESETSVPGTGPNIYGNASHLRQLELRDGTGSINDLMREGYRLPEGPTSVPSPDAFNCLGQDTGITVWDVWYLDGATPANDPALIKMTGDLFLQF